MTIELNAKSKAALAAVTLCGQEVDFNSAVNLMDDEIREELHAAMAPCNDQEFLDAYAKAHFEKYGEDFIVN